MSRFVTTWTPDEDARLIDMIGGGCTYSTVAIALGKTRSAVAGRCFRLAGKHKHYARPAKAVAA